VETLSDEKLLYLGRRCRGVRHLLDTSDFRVLAFFDDADEGGGLVERGKGACIEPGDAAVENANFQLFTLQIDLVDGSDLLFAAGGRLDG